MTDFKIVSFDWEASDKIFEGVEKLALAVRTTMGPSGRNVVIEKEGRPPHLTKDGVTVAQSVNLRNRFENLGAQIVKEAAQRSAEVAGDGTTTSTVLAHEIYSKGRQMVAAGFDPMKICRGIISAAECVSEELGQISVDVRDREDIVNVATISANGDREIGNMIADALDAVGKSGVITVEPAKGFDTVLDVVEGVKFDRGYVSPYFVTDQDRLHCELQKCGVFVTTQKIDNIKKILPVLEMAHETQKPILVICSDIDPEVTQALVLNKLKGTINVCVVKAPFYGDVQVEVIKDIAALTGTEAVNAGNYDENNGSLKEGWSLGKCKRAVVTKSGTLLVGCDPNESVVESRLGVVQDLLKRPSIDEQERDYYNMRSSMLTGAVAVIRVGGATEVEMRERKDRVDDAVSATMAANSEGILPGGGSALVKAMSSIKKCEVKGDESFNAGLRVVEQACEAPLRQIVKNTGGSPEVVLEKVLKSKQGRGYNARTKSYVNLLEDGIIDPTKVVRSAVENAASAACNLISIGCAIVDDDVRSEEKKDPLLINRHV